MSDGDFGGDDGGSDGGPFDLNKNGSSLDEFVIFAASSPMSQLVASNWSPQRSPSRASPSHGSTSQVH